MVYGWRVIKSSGARRGAGAADGGAAKRQPSTDTGGGRPACPGGEGGNGRRRRAVGERRPLSHRAGPGTEDRLVLRPARPSCRRRRGGAGCARARPLLLHRRLRRSRRTARRAREIGTASCRERVCRSGKISVVAVYIKKNKQKNN